MYGLVKRLHASLNLTKELRHDRDLDGAGGAEPPCRTVFETGDLRLDADSDDAVRLGISHSVGHRAPIPFATHPVLPQSSCVANAMRYSCSVEIIATAPGDEVAMAFVGELGPCGADDGTSDDID